MLFILGKRSCSEETFQEAVSAFRSALEVYTKESFPTEWAKAQLGLSISLAYLAVLRNDSATAEEALKAATDSLEWFLESSMTPIIDFATEARNYCLMICRDLGVSLSPEMQSLLAELDQEEDA